MKERIVELWKWEGLDHLIQISVLLLLVYGAAEAYQANQVLENEGCTAYWQNYKPGVNLSENRLVNASEAEIFKESSGTLASTEDLEKNYTIKNWSRKQNP